MLTENWSFYKFHHTILSVGLSMHYQPA